ncbi:MAG: S8 family serine peptidase [Burkholderiaceae bacterium]|nr:S8 family serine peptidase [Burkholderiaceae bacterium]
MSLHRYAPIRRRPVVSPTFQRSWRGVLALAGLSLLAACGGGGSGATGDGGTVAAPGSGLPSQDGCTYRYSLTGSTALTGADPLLAAQWHLNNTGQTGGTAGEDLRATLAWNLTRGDGVRVAVVDDAVETLHQDLQANVVTGASYNYRPLSIGNVHPLPCAADDDHGTAVAGIIAARDNNGVGGAGIAPRAGLVGYNALATSFVADLNDALGRGLADNGVYNNSWGSPDNGVLHRADASYLATIDNGIASGRGGRGAVYVFPAGNGGCYGTDSGTGACISETSGLDGYTNHRGVIVACSVDHRGRKPSYAEPGANLLVCGPSSNDNDSIGITTLALLGGFRNDFNGSSAATPMVSGVAALILAANPQLTWRDVRLILAQTARRNDSTDTGWVTSAFGPAHNGKYGFGVADANAAVAAARTWTSVGGASSLKSCGPYSRTPNTALPDSSGGSVAVRSDSVAVGADCAITRIEYVEVAFTASHAYAGDLRVRLVSPNGLVSELASERVCGGACGSFDDWRFGSVRHLGEPAAGSWTLQVSDAQAEDTGTWQAWGLRFWGR